ncbi:autotransporter domain-containing protein [uncultured Castellaniella sp.]|uniref:autotransporter outer membrane beta-barrel domain-containing protein n=1 Tax=uncultured Castellaniella sp. TaxID=647907 RepID=UPI002610B48D|nr:autotransporter domain-containing protein [uncultured Castellaniella sp.]
MSEATLLLGSPQRSAKAPEPSSTSRRRTRGAGFGHGGGWRGQRNLTLVVALSGVFAMTTLPTPAFGADWGGGDGDWSDSGQWSPASTPDSSTDVNVKSGTARVQSGTANSRNAVIDTGGKVEVSGSGAVWDNDGNSPGFGQRGGAIVVGDTGAGTLDISNGGTVKTTGSLAGSVLIGNQAGSNGTVSVGGGSGAATLESVGPVGYPGNFYVGYDGTGTLNVTAGGLVTGFQGMTLGVGATGDGTLIVDGGSVDVTPGSLDVGKAGRGTLIVKNGGTVASRGGTVFGNSGSSATVTGRGSAWNLGAGGLRVGTGYDGTLGIADHGAVDATAGQFYLGQGAGSGVLTIQSGGTLKTNGAFIGQSTAGAQTRVSITGAGSDWNAVVGDGSASWFWTYSGAAGTTVDVTAGGHLTTGQALIGDVGTAGTTITVDGSGSAWDNIKNIHLGYGSSGTLNLVNGGAVSTSVLKLYAPGTFNLGTGGLAGRFTGASIVNDGRIVADFTDAATLDSVISGSGTLTKKGAGVLALNGASTAYAGTTSVEGGTLTVGDDSHPGASLSGNVNVNTAGTLGGIGTLEHVTVASGGTLAPGNSIGTIKVADITFAPGSTYAAEINAAGQSDRIVASGAATINGGTVKVLAGSGTYATRTDYTLLTADGGITRNSDFSVASNLAFLTPSLSYDANHLYLSMARNTTDFAAVGFTPNQRAVGAGAESLGMDSPVYGALVNLSAAQARAAMDQLAGDAHASARGMLLESSHFVRDAIDGRLRVAFEDAGAPAPHLLAYGYGGSTVSDSGSLPGLGTASAPAHDGRFSAWGSTFGSWGDTDGDGNAAGQHRSTGGFLAGVDGLVAPRLRLGILAGYSHDRFSADGLDASGSSDNYHLGVYGGTQRGALGLRVGAAYSWHDVSTRRAVAFSGFADRLTADYDAGTFQAFGELGYRIDTAAASFEPFANLAYARLHTDGFTEQGGAAALSSSSRNTDTTFTTLGLWATTQVDLGRASATARGMIGWRHAYGNTTPRTTLAFSGGDAFTVAGVPIAEDAAVLRTGLDFAVGRDATFRISYTGQFGSGSYDNGAEADLNIRF